MTVAPPIVDDDTTTIEAHEFEIPCEQTFGIQRTPCPRPAAWIHVVRPHCHRVDESITVLVCEQDHENIVNGTIGWCRRCLTFSPMKDLVISMERLKP